MMKNLYLIIGILIAFNSCLSKHDKANQVNPETDNTDQVSESLFPNEIVDFQSYSVNPVFAGTDSNTWDQHIRERGYILKESDGFHMWYTGFRKENVDRDTLFLGYATSKDGIEWTRYPDNPIYKENWVEDMMVLKDEGLYYMFAEGRHDIAHWLTSKDRIHWIDQGSLDIRQVNGEALSKGPYGTPTVWKENGIWYLFYERNDLGIWLATSIDLEIWTNVTDDPILEMGPEPYDQYGLAVNQIIKYEGIYYAYYHGTAYEDWHEWSTNVARSTDLINWEKYNQNPIMEENKSSGILIADDIGYRLYTMHDQVHVHFKSK